MIQLSFNDTDQRVIASIESMPTRIVEALRGRMDILLALLQARIVSDKLSGQVLQHRTGKLAGSIRMVPATASGAVVEGSVLGAGGPAPYGAVHEYGGTRSYTIMPIDKKALAFMLGGAQIVVKSVLHPPLPERSFMRSSLEEMKPEILAGLQDEMNSTAGGS